MAWLVGIDEAGYGPNLGPLVMTLVACRVADESDDADLWDAFKACVRRHREPDDGRLVVADSKLVYSSGKGLTNLEKTALACLRGALLAEAGTDPFCLDQLLAALAPDTLADVRQEAWYAGTSALPLVAGAADVAAACPRVRETLGAGFCCSAIVCAPRFNDVVERCDTKAGVLGLGLAQLVRACLSALPSEPMALVLDKHGGRNQYASMLQLSFGGGLVMTEVESAGRSVYRIEGLDRPVRVTVVPRADADHFAVALASMVSKYVREALMREFNQFWQRHVPGIKATAGYPSDATRFFEAIRPAMTALGLCERQVWRRK
jgi:ribonuclease HII